MVQPNGYGEQAESDFPSCWTDGATWKGLYPHCESATNCFAQIYREASDFRYTSDATLLRSTDAGAHWFNPAHRARQADANGDPYCPGDAAAIMWPGRGKLSQIAAWVDHASGVAGAVNNPIDGMDAYQYAIARASDMASEVLAEGQYRFGLPGENSSRARVGLLLGREWLAGRNPVGVFSGPSRGAT